MENKYGEPIRAENRVKNTGIVRAGWKRNWFGVYMEGYTVTAWMWGHYPSTPADGSPGLSGATVATGIALSWGSVAPEGPDRQRAEDSMGHVQMCFTHAGGMWRKDMITQTWLEAWKVSVLMAERVRTGNRTWPECSCSSLVSVPSYKLKRSLFIITAQQVNQIIATRVSIDGSRRLATAENTLWIINAGPSKRNIHAVGFSTRIRFTDFIIHTCTGGRQVAAPGSFGIRRHSREAFAVTPIAASSIADLSEAAGFRKAPSNNLSFL